ncbi:P-loop containing nucleoside triphosphate hydrolase protein [Triangularia verruculosa]|uniref:P-loop containing nucleoside triphosphate hydrolase protein n=1 Tax=Triangularia verruculosa TaxID=2587418 RepID=A0AAN6XMT2_9PEZI|nr:P-loop containing nucleoside triphosphate hydrolase protein [Triangularia verruculosa]
MNRELGYDPILHKLFIIENGDDKELEYRSDWEQLLTQIACSEEDPGFVEIEIRPDLEDIPNALRGIRGSDMPPISDKPFSSLKPSTTHGDDEYRRAILSAISAPSKDTIKEPKEKNSSDLDDYPEMDLERGFITEGEYWDMKYCQRQHKFPTSLPEPGFLSKRGYTRDTKIAPWYFLPDRYFDDSPPSSPKSATTTISSTTEILSLGSPSNSPNHGEEDSEIDSYQITTTEDPDYGATSRDVIDDSLPTCNPGDTEGEWAECLRFFCTDVQEYKRQFAIKTSSATHTTRIPVKKLPGMTVGLFDYQLMGVYNLIKLLLYEVKGGFLADEQGLGKTQEMFGVLLLAHNLRRCYADVMEAWKPPTKATRKKLPMQHNSRSLAEPRSCPYDQRWGFKCMCYNHFTEDITSQLPHGPNIIIAPARNCGPMIRDAKSKLDSKVIKVRGYGNDIHISDKDSKLTSVELTSLRSGNATTQSDFVIVVSPESIHKLVAEFTKNKATLTPGIIMLDEFHQYAAYSGEVNRVLDWLKHLKAVSLSAKRPSPLIYFVSGTPMESSPSDLRSALEVLDRPSWYQLGHPMSTSSTLLHLDHVINLYNSHTAAQAQGVVMPRNKVYEYYSLLGRILCKVMVRRLATDSFQGVKLTSLGKLKVNIIDHTLPSHHIAPIQSLANSIPTTANLKSVTTGPPLLLKLRLCGTFPAISGSTAANFTFSDNEVKEFLSAAEGNPAKTPYHQHINSGSWTGPSSPKLATISKIITEMINDKTKIPGESSSAKKLVLFSPLEAESLLLFLWLTTPKKPEGVKPVYVHGGMTSQERQKVIDRFLEVGNSAPNVLVAPTGVCGTGFNLQKAGYLVLTGPTWTRREGRQVFGRVHRVGQRGQVKLWELRGGWNPAERVILGGEGGMEVDNRFVERVGEEGEGGRGSR